MCFEKLIFFRKYYFPRSLIVCFENMIFLREYYFQRKLIIGFVNMICSCENMNSSKEINSLLGKYAALFQKYEFYEFEARLSAGTVVETAIPQGIARNNLKMSHCKRSRATKAKANTTAKVKETVGIIQPAHTLLVTQRATGQWCWHW